MPSEPRQHVTRIDRRDLADLPPEWTDQERGRHLRLLFQQRGIDPDRLFRLEYYPHRHCWVLIQDADPRADKLPPHQPDRMFYRQVTAEFRRAALAALAAHGPHFLGKFQLPPEPQELTPAKLIDLLGGPGGDAAPVRFTSEGGWRASPSEN